MHQKAWRDPELARVGEQLCVIERRYTHSQSCSWISLVDHPEDFAAASLCLLIRCDDKYGSRDGRLAGNCRLSPR